MVNVSIAFVYIFVRQNKINQKSWVFHQEDEEWRQIWIGSVIRRTCVGQSRTTLQKLRIGFHNGKRNGSASRALIELAQIWWQTTNKEDAAIEMKKENNCN